MIAHRIKEMIDRVIPQRLPNSKHLADPKYFPVGDTSLSLGLSRKRLPQVRPHHDDLYPVRIAFHTRSDDRGSMIERTHDERNHFQGSGPDGHRVPRVAAEAATRG